MKVLLVSMPFGALDRPALGISQLKAELAGRGVACDVRYLTFPFAEFLGYADYVWVQGELPYTAFAGDWCFTRSLYGRRQAADAAYLREVFLGQWKQDAAAVRRLLGVRDKVEAFLERCLDEVPWRRYGAVGFTSTFEQNIASLALARRVKRAHPGAAVVFGGANWEGEMGMELMRRFPFVDYVCSGEAEHSFPALLGRLGAGPAPGPRSGRGKSRDPRRNGGRASGGARSRIPGVYHRSRSGPVSGGPNRIVEDMDSLAIPDFSDFYEQLDRSTVASSILPTLLFESSRGCWWGAKSHCTFCGLNGHSMAFRSKSAPRVLEELEQLTGRWRTDSVDVVDNILDMQYFNSVLPVLAESGRPWHIFYETKANLSRRQVELLARAGVDRIQPGIESLSDHVLGLMRKGTTALRNVQLLKWCREYGIAVDWNLLYGFPGETAEDYAKQVEIFEAIRFYGPPGACGPIRLDRFSPYFDDPKSFGLANLRPMAPYRYLYPFEPSSVARIAYYFDFDYHRDVDPRGVAGAAIRDVERWQRMPPGGELRACAGPEGRLVLRDTRTSPAPFVHVLDGLEREVYELCDQVRSMAVIMRFVRERDPAIEEQAVRDHLDSLVANALMLRDGDRYLALALGAPSRAEAPAKTAPPSARSRTAIAVALPA